MLNLFRSREKTQKLVLSILLGLVAVSMLVYLIPGGFGTMGDASGANVVAQVGDQQVTTQDVDRQVTRMTRSQPNLPKAYLAMFVPQMVENLITEKAMAYKARQMGLRVSDEEISQTVQSQVAPALGGKFTMDGYQALLQQNGLTPDIYEGQLREDMLATRLQQIQAQAIVVTEPEAKAEYARRNQKVALEYIGFTAKDFEGKVDKDPAKVKAYFDRNRGLFRTPEKRDVYVVVGSLMDFAKNINVSDEQLRKTYQDEIDSFRTPEQVRARHILIKTQGKSDAEKKQAKAKADDLLKQLQHGGNFEELAKKNSDDPGSAVKGGELGFLGHGQTVPNFDKALFTLQPGQLSGVIETDYGYHIIQAEEKKPAHTMSFDEAKPQLMAELQKQGASDALDRAASAARGEIARNPAQVEAIAKKYGLQAIRVDGFTRGSALPMVGNQPGMVNAIFTTPKNGVTDITNIDQQGQEAFAVVTNVTAAHEAEFADVQGEVTQRYVQAEAQKLADDAAKAAADRAKKGEALEAIAKSYGVQVKTAAPFTIEGAAEGIGSASSLEAAFKTKVGGIVGPVNAATGEFVCKVTQSIPADMAQFAAAKETIMQTMKQQRIQVDGPLFHDSVVAELKRKGKIKMNQDTISKMVNSYKS